MHTLKEGRNEFTFDIDGIDFHIIYDRSTSLSTPEAKRSLVLLSHALMADHTMYDSTVKTLNDAGYDTLRYDHLGHGGETGTGLKNGGWKGRRWDFDDFTGHMHDIVQMVIEMEDVQLKAVVGCSMGGVLALRYAMLYGEEYKRSEKGKLKVVSMGAPGVRVLEGVKRSGRTERMCLEKTGWMCWRSGRLSGGSPDPVAEGVRERVEEMCKRTSLEGYEKCAEGIVSYNYADKGELEALREGNAVDVLIIRGEKDEAVGPKSISMDVAQRIGGRFVGMEGVGHLPPMHDPAGFEKLLLKFLKD